MLATLSRPSADSLRELLIILITMKIILILLIIIIMINSEHLLAVKEAYLSDLGAL